MTESTDTGLSSVEAAQRLAEQGPNDPTPRSRNSHCAELLLQFANPLVAILLLATADSATVGFEPLPPACFLFLAATTLTYLELVEVAKRNLLGGRVESKELHPIAALVESVAAVSRGPSIN